MNDPRLRHTPRGEANYTLRSDTTTASSRPQFVRKKGRNWREMSRRRTIVTTKLMLKRARDQVSRDFPVLLEQDLRVPCKADNDGECNPVPSMTVDEILNGLFSSNEDKQLEAVKSARIIVSHEHNPDVNILIERGFVEYCVYLLSICANANVLFEATWALTNIAGGTSDQARSAVKAGAIPGLLTLLKQSSDHKVVEQTVWALQNIAGDEANGTELVHGHNALPLVLEVATSETSIVCQQNILGLLSNVCLLKESPPTLEQVSPWLPLLRHLLHHSDEEIVRKVCWVLYSMTEHPTLQLIQPLVDTGMLPSLVSILASKNVDILMPTLYVLGNVAAANDSRSALLLNAGILPHLTSIYSKYNTNKFLRDECDYIRSAIHTGVTNCSRLCRVVLNRLPEAVTHENSVGSFPNPPVQLDATIPLLGKPIPIILSRVRGKKTVKNGKYPYFR